MVWKLKYTKEILCSMLNLQQENIGNVTKSKIPEAGIVSKLDQKQLQRISKSFLNN
jgi:hypothetical protein